MRRKLVIRRVLTECQLTSEQARAILGTDGGPALTARFQLALGKPDLTESQLSALLAQYDQ